MKPLHAILFALAGVAMLVGIGYALSIRSTGLGAAFAAGFVLVCGAGFAWKARVRRQQDQ